jgi:hypothetical protein
MVAVANMVTATARKMWIKEIRKPTLESTQHMDQQSINAIKICYEGTKELTYIKEAYQQIHMLFKRDLKNKAEIQSETHSELDRIRIEEFMIPKLICEEAQETALMRTIYIQEQSRNIQVKQGMEHRGNQEKNNRTQQSDEQK